MLEAVHSTDINKAQPAFGEGGLLKELIAQYLVHEGYIETAKTFVKEVDSETAALRKPSMISLTRSTTEDDLDACNRQRMCLGILQNV